jgi:hypothetical protein
MRLGCQPLSATLLDVVDIDIVGRATIEAHLDGLAEGIHLGGAELFAFLHQAQAIPHNLAGSAVGKRSAKFGESRRVSWSRSSVCIFCRNRRGMDRYGLHVVNGLDDRVRRVKRYTLASIAG